MASLSNPVNVNKLLATQLAAQKAEINAHVDSKTTETKAHVTSKSTDTKNHVTSKASATDSLLNAETLAIDTKLDDISKVNGQLDTNVAVINAHTTQELSQLESVGVPIDGVLAFNVPADKGLFTASGGVFLPSGSVSTDLASFPDANVTRAVFIDEVVTCLHNMSISAMTRDKSTGDFYLMTTDTSDNVYKLTPDLLTKTNLMASGAQNAGMMTIAVSNDAIWTADSGSNTQFYKYDKSGNYTGTSLTDPVIDNTEAIDFYNGLIYAITASNDIYTLNPSTSEVIKVVDGDAMGFAPIGSIAAFTVTASGIIAATSNRYIYQIVNDNGTYTYDGNEVLHDSDPVSRMECIVPVVDGDLSDFWAFGGNTSEGKNRFKDVVGHPSLKHQYGTLFPLCVRVK